MRLGEEDTRFAFHAGLARGICDIVVVVVIAVAGVVVIVVVIIVIILAQLGAGGCHLAVL